MRYIDLIANAPMQLAHGLRSRLREGYGASDFRADLMAGLIVGVVALPLSMALAIASGAPPQYGLYTAIIAGTLCALLGGSRLQITGPTAAFVVLLVPVVGRHGLGGLLVAGLMAGIIQIIMGVARLGRLVEFIPHPVTTGFTSGIALVIASIQLKDVFGLELARAPESFIERFLAYWEARGTASGWELGVAVATLALLVLLPRIIKRVPAPLIALTIVTIATVVLERYVAGFDVATIGSRFRTVVDGREIAGIPPLPPLPVLPWNLGGAGGQPFTLDFATIQALLPSAFAIAMLGAIESLLSAVIADGITGTRHDANGELIALGIGNVLCPFFGGIPATGALARTATNIRSGAQSPFASVIHALFVLACTVALAPLVAYLPMAALAGLLLMVAKNMSEAHHFARLVRIAPRSDVFVLVTCFGLTVIFDMVISVGVGVVMAALLFMRRMAALTDAHLDSDTTRDLELPEGVRLYDIAGPLFFGAAQKAMGAMTPEKGATTVILKMDQVPVIDATGLVALESAVHKLKRAGCKIIFSGLADRPAELLARAGIVREPGRIAFAPDLDTALSLALVHDMRMRAGTAPQPAGSAS
ncbi:MAG TPA: C4-dicarboxylic acid transporter DauA [Haliangium sp.]|nr:C4-dicarboxylic acid transporter DauA [Haliangium sp.]